MASLIAPWIGGESGSVRDLEHVLWKVRFTVLLQLAHWKLRCCDAWTLELSASLDQAAARTLDYARQYSSDLQT